MTAPAATADHQAPVVPVRVVTFERRYGWIAGVLGYLAIFFIYAPVVWLAVMSVSGDPLSGLPSEFTLGWYAQLVADKRWMVPLGLSVIMGLIVGLACTVSAVIVGRALPRMRRGGLLILGFLLPLFIPGVLLGVALFLYFRAFLGLHLGLWSVFVAHFVWAFPFALLAVLVMTARFDARLLEAAADLGATPQQRFWHIEFPLLKPGIISAGLFGFLLSFNELSRSILLRGFSTTLPVFEWAQATSHTSSVPLIYALSSLMLIISLGLISVAFWYLFARQH